MKKTEYTARRELTAIKPYYLVIHEISRQSAVYNRSYEKIFEDASDKLINYANRNHAQFEVCFRLTKPEQLPSWMASEMKADCVCYHLYNDDSTITEIRRIPGY